MAALLRRHADVRETPDEIQVMSIKGLLAQCRTSGARSAEQLYQLFGAISVGDDLKVCCRDADVQLRLSLGPAASDSHLLH
jgi:hypothetical protein